MRLRAPDPALPAEPIEPPHTHEENREPDQELISESHVGRSPSDRTKPCTLVVGATTASFLQCQDVNVSLLGGRGTPPDPSFWLRLKEGSPSSFKRRRYDYFTLGKAKTITGTRIQIRFHNLSAGVHVFVPPIVPLTAISQHPPTTAEHPAKRACLQLVAASLTSDGFPPSRFGDVTTSEANRPAEVSYERHTGYATYEVLHSDPTVIHEAIVNVYVAYIANTAQNLPVPGPTSITTAFSPDPRSRPVETSPLAAFTINVCPSALLFPFVTNQGGLDTRIVITNTSLDPFGTSAEHGTVRLYFFGNGDTEGRNPRPVVTQTVPAGKQLDFNLAKGGNFGTPAVPGFQGYIIAIPNFRYSHGFALISGPAGEAAASYPAEPINARAGLPELKT
jgi:hypothetical protein